MMDAVGLWNRIGKRREGPLSHVAIPLMGRFKGGNGSRHYLQVIINDTDSRLNFRWWLESLNYWLIRQGQRNGPACCDEEVNLAQASQYQETLVNFLTEIQQERPNIILEDVNVGEDYGIGRSLRRGAEVRALNTRVPEPVISAINLWWNIERAKGTQPRFIILEHYADVVLMLETILQLSRPLLHW